MDINPSNDKDKKGKEENLDTFDLSIFKHDETTNNECDASNYTKCIAMSRLIRGFKYYSLLNIINNENDREIFRHFMIAIYCVFCDDNIHFQDHHTDELEQIRKDLINTKQFNECHINGCDYTARHHRATANKPNDVLEPKLNFYKDMMDAFHFYIFHCFEAGLRVIHDGDDDENEDEDEKHCEYFDAVFARIHRKIIKTQQNTELYNRLSNKNTKFTILTQNKDTINDKNANDENVYCDEIFKYLLKVKMNIDGLKELHHWIQSEQYDTDALKYDESLETNGNITKTIKNKTFKKFYLEFIKNTKISSNTFSIGFRFYYWGYYRYIKQLNEDYKNINDHSGFEVNQLFIEPKYYSLKEEITHNKHISIQQYEEEIITKVNEYKESARFKKITATPWGAQYLHYEIRRGDAIRIDHLLSLVLYTDYTNLCTEFSGTFRRKNIFEPLKNVIKRNMEYYWMSKCLRECVEIFGQCHIDSKRWKKDYIRGAFYSGMSIVMNLNSFNMRLCSPTSTSRQIAVVMKFSGTQGMILQLNNPRKYQYDRLHGFNASWISKYKEEDERLFFGGFWCIVVESVRIRNTKQNFERFMFSLYYLDTMLCGSNVDKMEITQHDAFIIEHLVNEVLNKNNEITKRFDHYLYSTFVAFTLTKTQIVLYLCALHDINRKQCGIRDLLMNDLEKRFQKKEKKREDKDITNLFKAEIFEIFKNIHSIVINTTMPTGYMSCSLSMIGLLSVIESYSVQQIVVTAESDRQDEIDRDVWSNMSYDLSRFDPSYTNNNNWIKALWSSSSNILLKVYQDRNYTIAMTEKGDREACFIITNYNKM